MSKQMNKQNQSSQMEVLMSRTIQKLKARLGELETDLILAQTQLEMTREELQKEQARNKSNVKEQTKNKG